MRDFLSNHVLGFHGCDKARGEHVLSGAGHLPQSVNKYDWLGHGVYFWECAPLRAIQFARWKRAHMAKKGREMTPCVVGAVLDLGNCLNLLDAKHYELLNYVYNTYVKKTPISLVPHNTLGRDRLLRYRDCAVFEAFHTFAADQKLRPFDSIRGAFEEGKPVFPGAGIRDKTHIQICIRNPGQCIKGYFRLVDENGMALKFE